jgi:hypothetical protein
MKKITEQKDRSIPEFKSLEEEREYWESRGPLAEGHKGVLNRPEPNKKRTSFLSVRLTGEELDRLYEIAKERGVGPSTFTRMVLISLIEQHDKPTKTITFEQACEAMVNSMPESLKDKFANLYKDVSLSDKDNPPFLLIDSKQMTEFAKLTSWSFLLLSSMFGIYPINPGDVHGLTVKLYAAPSVAANVPSIKPEKMDPIDVKV